MADPLISSQTAPDADLVQAYLTHVRVEKRLAERTVALYTLDLEKLVAYAAEAELPLRAVHQSHIRRWVARMHSGGRSARGIGWAARA
jgi:integrase/recombinase XerC